MMGRLLIKAVISWHFSPFPYEIMRAKLMVMRSMMMMGKYHFLTRRKAVRRAVPRITAARAQMMLKVPELTPCGSMSDF